jgi:hypothetical protein
VLPLGALLLVGLVAVGLSQAIGAAFAQRHFRALNKIVEEVIADPASTADDRQALIDGLEEAVQRWPVVVVAISAPFICVPTVIAAAIDAIRHRHLNNEQLLESARIDLRRVDAILNRVGDPPVYSQAYISRRTQFEQHSLSALAWTSPLLTLWIAICLFPGFVAFAIFGATSLASSRFRLIFEAALYWLSKPSARAV